MNIFHNQQTNDVTKSQNFFTAQGYGARYYVQSEELTSYEYIVSIWDEATGKYIYTFTLNTEQSADAMEELLNQEIGYWDCGDYYNPSPEREADDTLRADTMSAIKGGF